MEYEIVTSQYAHEVTRRVNELLQDDWKLHGELHTAAYSATWVNGGREETGHLWMFAQAMVRKEKKKAKPVKAEL